MNPDDLHPLPSIPCSRNLRRRTGIFLGLEPNEIMAIAVSSLLPTFAQKMGLLDHVSPLFSLAILGGGLLFVVLFKKGKQPHYFSLWLHHHFLHPKAWRAPRTDLHNRWPILDDKLSKLS